MCHQVDLVIENEGVGVTLDEVDHLAQDLIHEPRVVADTGDPQRGALPVIKTIHLRDRDVKASVDAILDAFDYSPFALERVVAWDTQFDAAGSDGNGQNSFELRVSGFG